MNVSGVNTSDNNNSSKNKISNNSNNSTKSNKNGLSKNSEITSDISPSDKKKIKCCIRYCPSHFKKQTLFYFSFPLDGEKRKEWLRAISGRADMGLFQTSEYICSLHFAKGTLDPVTGRPEANAKPTIFSSPIIKVVPPSASSAPVSSTTPASSILSTTNKWQPISTVTLTGPNGTPISGPNVISTLNTKVSPTKTSLTATPIVKAATEYSIKKCYQLSPSQVRIAKTSETKAVTSTVATTVSKLPTMQTSSSMTAETIQTAIPPPPPPLQPRPGLVRASNGKPAALLPDKKPRLSLPLSSAIVAQALTTTNREQKTTKPVKLDLSLPLSSASVTKLLNIKKREADRTPDFVSATSTPPPLKKFRTYVRPASGTPVFKSKNPTSTPTPPSASTTVKSVPVRVLRSELKRLIAVTVSSSATTTVTTTSRRPLPNRTDLVITPTAAQSPSLNAAQSPSLKISSITGPIPLKAVDAIKSSLKPTSSHQSSASRSSAHIIKDINEGDLIPPVASKKDGYNAEYPRKLLHHLLCMKMVVQEKSMEVKLMHRRLLKLRKECAALEAEKMNKTVSA